MARVQSEYDVEARFIERLGEIGFDYIELKNYEDVLRRYFRKQEGGEEIADDVLRRMMFNVYQ